MPRATVCITHSVGTPPGSVIGGIDRSTLKSNALAKGSGLSPPVVMA